MAVLKKVAQAAFFFLFDICFARADMEGAWISMISRPEKIAFSLLTEYNMVKKTSMAILTISKEAL